MRRFKISVDGVSYDVTVEELEADGQRLPTMDQPMPKASADAGVGNPPPPPRMPTAAPAVKTHPGNVVSPLAGTVIEVKVTAGQLVKQGDPLLILEAMKMESVVVAPTEGRVQNISVSAGQPVQEGHVLLSLV
ncbi:MAG: biotin/lipoyl-binding protein [Gammaproteobacteria bacterium]|nr:biotin/lipoyl-binding protein [Gammaproteobacteria bacterium]